MKDWPAGSHLVKETKTVNNIGLLAIGYKYNQRKVLSFLATKGVGHTEPGKAYEARWKDEHNNTQSREIPRPAICSTYFEHCNAIDVQNQSRQFDLHLDKQWITNDGYFRIATTVFGMTIVDMWHGYQYHLNHQHRHKSLTAVQFASILAKDCLNNGFSRRLPSEMAFTIGIPSNLRPQPSLSPMTASLSAGAGATGTTMNTVASTSTAATFSHVLEVCPYVETYNKRGREGQINNGTRNRRGYCRACKKKTRWFCNSCDDTSGAKLAWYCNTSDCKKVHEKQVMGTARNSNSSGR